MNFKEAVYYCVGRHLTALAEAYISVLVVSAILGNLQSVGVQ